MKKISAEELFTQFRESVQLLALGAEQQEEWLTRNGYGADELALQIDDTVPAWFDRLQAAGYLDEVSKHAAVLVSRTLETLSDNPDLWSMDALRNSPRWDQVRIQARQLLEDLDARSS